MAYIKKAEVARQTTIIIAKKWRLLRAYKVIAYELMNFKNRVAKLRNELELEAKEAREEKIEIDKRYPAEDEPSPINNFFGIHLFTSNLSMTKNDADIDNGTALGVVGRISFPFIKSALY